DQCGSVQFANRAARQLVTDAIDMRALSQLVGATNAQQAFMLNQTVEAAIAAHHAGQEYTDSLAIPRSKGLRNLLVTVCALGDSTPAPDDADSGHASDPAVVIFISDPESRRPAPVDALVSLFDLTATEAQIAWAFAQGLRSDDIAASFGISPTT